MAARKLQTEIERTLKKVAEGVELFEGIFEKIQTSTNQTQKEKLEVDLKSQIKKLQRLRDQIKTWMQSNDIKDKQPLLDNRKLIETQMERFKACEKEMKTKAFSKEGLSAAAKLDPKEQQKLELCQWTTTMVDELSRQVEQAEAEIETLQLLKKKKDSDREQRLDQLETLNERRAWHINRLELILRLLENGNLQTEAVADIKDDIAYFVESNTEEDFEEDEGIYEDLNLQEEEDMYQVGGDDFQSSHDSTSVADDTSHASIPTPAPPKTPAKEKASKKAPAPVEEESSPVKKTTARKSTLDSTTPRPTNLTTPSRSVSGPQPTPRTAPAPMPTIRYAAAAAANLPPTPTLSSAPAPSSAAPPSATANAAAPPPGLSASPASTPSSEAPPAPAVSSPDATKATADAASSLPSPLAAPGVGQPSPSMSSASVPNSNGPSASSAPSVSSQSQAPATSPAPSSASLPQPTATDVLSEQQKSAEEQAQQQAQQQQQRPNEPRLPSSLADLVTSFESAKQKSMNRDNDLGAIHQILDSGFSNVPQPLDAEKPKYYVPRQPFATPGYYPQEPSGQFANPALFAKLDVDTLFYIFYYCQGTYLQYLAASELKKQSWRFHKQYLTWFQRANEPQQITDEYEQGVYLYFDWEGSWCQRRKNDFKFSYKFLDSD